MTMTDSLDGLIERVERCTGPDREIDAEISAMLLGSYIKREPSPRHWRHAPEHSGPYARLPAYTASIDDTPALVERKLPGWGCQVGRPIQTYVSGFYASVFRARLPTEHGALDGHFSDWGEDLHPRPRDSYRPNGAIAIILATLRALQSIKTSETPT